MANPFITQNGTVFSRNPDQAFVTGAARIEITPDMVGANLVATMVTSAPFDAVLDEQGTYWQLRDRDVVYGEHNVQINLYSIYEIRNMISAQATIQISDSTSSMTLTRYRESDPIRGFAWRNGNAAVYTKTPVAATGIAWYTDPQMTSSGGLTTSHSNPSVTSAYQGGWMGVFSVVPKQLSYTPVSSGTYSVQATK
jgi:hypothetical protein